MSRVKVTVLSDASASPVVAALLPPFAASTGIPEDDERRVAVVVEAFLGFTLDNAYPDDDLGEIEVTLEARDGVVEVVVHDWGLPLTSAGGDLGPLPEALAALAPNARNVQLLNLGSEGKRLAAEVPVRSDDRGQTARHHVEAAQPMRLPLQPEVGLGHRRHPLLFLRPHRGSRVAEPATPPRPDLHEDEDALVLRDHVQLAVARAIAPVKNEIPARLERAAGQLLPVPSKPLPGHRHGRGRCKG